MICWWELFSIRSCLSKFADICTVSGAIAMEMKEEEEEEEKEESVEKGEEIRRTREQGEENFQAQYEGTESEEREKEQAYWQATLSLKVIARST